MIIYFGLLFKHWFSLRSGVTLSRHVIFFMKPVLHCFIVDIGRNLLLEIWRILRFTRISDSVISWLLYREYLYIPVPGE